MARRSSSDEGSNVAVSFWLIVGLICVVGGALAYQAGRYWVTDLISDVQVDTGQIQLPSQGTEGSPPAGRASHEAPGTAEVTVEEREPTEAEKREIELRTLEREAARQEPQDGAELNERIAVAAVEDEGDWMVVAGSFLQKANADRAADKLSRKGYAPFITEFEKDGLKYRRVTVAIFRDREEAGELVSRLAEEGITATVVKR